MCKCKKAMTYDVVLTWGEGSWGVPAYWLISLYATCKRCGDDNGREPIGSVTIGDDVSAPERATRAHIRRAIVDMLPKGVRVEDVKVSE